MHAFNILLIAVVWLSHPLLAGGQTALALGALGAASANQRLAYQIQVTLEPAHHELKVAARIQFPSAMAGHTLDFLLADALRIERAEPTVERRH